MRPKATAAELTLSVSRQLYCRNCTLRGAPTLQQLTEDGPSGRLELHDVWVHCLSRTNSSVLPAVPGYLGLSVTPIQVHCVT